MTRCRRLRCPACGLFGRKARRRDERSHVVWSSLLVTAFREDALPEVTRCSQSVTVRVPLSRDTAAALLARPIVVPKDFPCP